MMKKGFLFFNFVFSLLFFSCGKLNLVEDFSTSQSSNKIVHTITGKSENQSFKSVNEIANSRNAIPTYESSNLFYYFSATADNQETQTLATSKNSFTFTLQNETWTISCEIYYGSDLTESNYSNGSKLFVGNTTLTLTDESPTSENIEIQTLPYTESDSKGSVSLLIYTETTSVKSATASWENLSTNAIGTQVLNLTQQDSSKNYCDTFNFNGNSVQAGVYKVGFKFYSGEVSSGTVSGSLICSTTKIVNVANSLTTDEWTTNGGFIQNGKFSISASNILISKAKAIYVDGDATTNGNGISVLSPLNSFEDAVSLVKGFGIDAPICIKSGTTATFSNEITISRDMTLTTYAEDGTIYNDASTILDSSKRGIIKRTSNVSISVSKSVTLSICNVDFTESVAEMSLNALFDFRNSGGKLDGSNSSITSNRPLIMYATSVSANLSNMDFIGSSKNDYECVGILVNTSSSLTIKDSSFTGFYEALSFGSLANSVSVSISDTKFTGNYEGIDATNASVSLVLKNLTVSDNSWYGIKTKNNISFLGTCTLNGKFYFDSDDVTINFDSTYKNADGNSVLIYAKTSYHTRGRQILTGENVSTNYSSFSMGESGWAINSKGYLYETNVTSATNQYYYVDPTNGDDSTAEGGNYDKAYKTLQGAVDAINTANAATSGKEYTMYLLSDLQIDSSTTFTTTSDESAADGTTSTPTLCYVENSSSNELTLNVLSWATDSASYATISGDASTVGRLFKVNGSTSTINLSVDNLNITNLCLYKDSDTKYFGAVLFMCGTSDTATFGSGVKVSDCTTYYSLIYPRYGTLNLNCSITNNKSDMYGVVVKLVATGTLNFIGGEISGSTDFSGNAQADIAVTNGGDAIANISGGKIDYLRVGNNSLIISNDAHIETYCIYNPNASFIIDDSYTTTDVSKIFLLWNNFSDEDTVFSIADSSSLSISDVIDRFEIYDSVSATSPSSTYSLEADSTGKKALLKIKATSAASGSTTTPFDDTVTFSSTASDSLVYGTENTITITATATSGKAITWGNVTVTTSGGTEISDTTYVMSKSTNCTSTTDGTSSTATCVVTFTSSMPPGTYYINVKANVNGVVYSGSVTAVVVK